LLILVISAVPGIAGASHEDGNYRVPARVMTKAVLDVLIIPPTHGQLLNDRGALNGGNPNEATPFNSYLKAIEEAIADWDRAIVEFGSERLKQGVVTNVYVVGRDSVPTDALTNPEIVITAAEEASFYLGVAVGSGGVSSGGTSVRSPCVISLTKTFIFSFSYADMYNVGAQEYGHCLGLGHVGNQGGVDPTADVQHPEHDTMNGFYTHAIGQSGTHLHCISNLDVKGLELSFGGLLGGPSGGTAVVAVRDYTTMSCPGTGPTSAPSPSASPTPSPTQSSSPSPTASDSPTPSPSASPTPTPAASPQERTYHPRTVSLRLRKHLRATGIVEATDGFSACSAGVTVRIERKVRGSWKSVARASAQSDGSYRARLRDAAGKFRARVVANEIDARDSCDGAVSRVVSHRH
jgi:hypothetical protein